MSEKFPIGKKFYNFKRFHFRIGIEQYWTIFSVASSLRNLTDSI